MLFRSHPLSRVVAKPPRLFQTASLSALYHARGVLSKIAALGVRRRATGGDFLIIYKVGDDSFPSAGSFAAPAVSVVSSFCRARRLGAPILEVFAGSFAACGRRVTFPAMGKSPKDRRGTPQRRTSFANDGFPPVPHYGGHPLGWAEHFRRAKSGVLGCGSFRATGPWVCGKLERVRLRFCA